MLYKSVGSTLKPAMRMWPISTHFNGRCRWDSNLCTSACESPTLPLCYGRRRIIQKRNPGLSRVTKFGGVWTAYLPQISLFVVQGILCMITDSVIAWIDWSGGARLLHVLLVTTVDAQWEGMGDVGSARYEPALLPPCPTIRVLSYSN